MIGDNCVEIYVGRIPIIRPWSFVIGSSIDVPRFESAGLVSNDLMADKIYQKGTNLFVHGKSPCKNRHDIEKALRGEPPDARKAARQKSSKPRIEALRLWFDDNLKRLPHKSGTAEAIRYAMSRWASLSRFLDDGSIEIDNNAAERAIRPIALGRKKWLFAGSDKGGERAAAIISLIETAKLNSINPEAYLREVLTRIADHPINTIDELLPWNVRMLDGAA